MSVGWPLAASGDEFVFEEIRRFGFADRLGEAPRANVILSRDGNLYGTTVGSGGVIYKIAMATGEYRVLKNFADQTSAGLFPYAPVTEGSDGLLYGVTDQGGEFAAGTIFRMRRDGGDFTVLRSFRNDPTDGQGARGALREGSDGFLYGTTTQGGAAGAGVVFRMEKDGRNYVVLKSFEGRSADGAAPQGQLLEGADGILYGVTYSGGASNLGTLFRLKKDGSGYGVMRSFGVVDGDGHSPVAGLIETRDGWLYGTTRHGGIAALGGFSESEVDSFGTIFRVRKDGSGYVTVWRFGSRVGDGRYPGAALIQGGDGGLYGTTELGGSYLDFGTVFRVAPDGASLTVLRGMRRESDGAHSPKASLIEAPDGKLYGTTGVGGTFNSGTVFRLARSGADFEVVHAFSPTGGDGAGPNAVAESSDGWLYGTTSGGGGRAMGTVYRVRRDGRDYSVLRSFSPVGGDGQRPAAGVIVGSDGMLYGTTVDGGSDDYGIVFRISPDGAEYSILKHFRSNGGDGRQPRASLIEGADGALYGITTRGGHADLGTVFTLERNGSNYAIVHSFAGGADDGASPAGSLIEGSDGVLYGTTEHGGPWNAGSVFRMNRDGSAYAVRALRGLQNEDAAHPRGRLLEGADGLLYGTTYRGGSGQLGTVFRMNKALTEYAVLANFGIDGGNSLEAGLVEGEYGALYGTTSVGGADQVSGTIFMLNRAGAASGFSVLKHFQSAAGDGIWPTSGLMKGADGLLYGATFSGGSHGTKFGGLYRAGVAPSLTIRRISGTGGVGTQVQLSWPTSPSGWSLFTASAPSELRSNWVPSVLPPVVSGSSNVVMCPATGIAQFFRLGR